MTQKKRKKERKKEKYPQSFPDFLKKKIKIWKGIIGKLFTNCLHFQMSQLLVANTENRLTNHITFQQKKKKKKNRSEMATLKQVVTTLVVLCFFCKLGRKASPKVRWIKLFPIFLYYVFYK